MEYSDRFQRENVQIALSSKDIGGKQFRHNRNIGCCILRWKQLISE